MSRRLASLLFLALLQLPVLAMGEAQPTSTETNYQQQTEFEQVQQIKPATAKTIDRQDLNRPIRNDATARQREQEIKDLEFEKERLKAEDAREAEARAQEKAEKEAKAKAAQLAQKNAPRVEIEEVVVQGGDSFDQTDDLIIFIHDETQPERADQFELAFVGAMDELPNWYFRFLSLNDSETSDQKERPTLIVTTMDSGFPARLASEFDGSIPVLMAFSSGSGRVSVREPKFGLGPDLERYADALADQVSDSQIPSLVLAHEKEFDQLARLLENKIAEKTDTRLVLIEPDDPRSAKRLIASQHDPNGAVILLLGSTKGTAAEKILDPTWRTYSLFDYKLDNVAFVTSLNGESKLVPPDDPAAVGFDAAKLISLALDDVKNSLPYPERKKQLTIKLLEIVSGNEPFIGPKTGMRFSDEHNNSALTIGIRVGGVVQTLDPLLAGRVPAPSTLERILRSAVEAFDWRVGLALSLALLLSLFTIRARQLTIVSEEKESVANLFVSDKPLDPGEPDELGMGVRALGLSRFLRNRNTEPPLTLAVTGKWGSGKSSLMNLLRKDLARHGHSSVWFNAWHHQKEERLLAALLENIRVQAIPAWWWPTGMAFRTRLLFVRSRRLWFLALAILFLLPMSVLLVANTIDDPDFVSPVTYLTAALGPVSDAPPESSTRLAGQSEEPEMPWTDSAKLLGSVMTLLGSFITLRGGLKTSGLSPGGTFEAIRRSSQVGALRGDLGFRYQFGREFSDVTEALRPRTLVIFIDDLDRCRPDNVIAVLEAVNFLMTVGRCVIVLGMDKDLVKSCVGLGFSDVAAELAASVQMGNGIDEKAQARLEREDFSIKYLQKLVNIEIPVPTGSSEQLAKILSAEEDEQQKQRGAGVHLRRLLVAIARTYAPLVLALVVLAAGFLWAAGTGMDLTGETAKPIAERFDGTDVPNAPERVQNANEGKKPDRPNADATPDPQIDAVPQSSRPTIEPTRKPNPVAALILRVQNWGPFPPLTVMCILLSLYVASQMLRERLTEVRDSREFANALNHWSSLLYERTSTPRAAKRFLNRVRCLAMLSGVEAAAAAAAETKSKATQKPVLSEAILVALCTIHECRPQWLEDASFWLDVGKYVGSQAKAPSALMAPEKLLKHTDEFSKWGSIEHFEQPFHKLVAGIDP